MVALIFNAAYQIGFCKTLSGFGCWFVFCGFLNFFWGEWVVFGVFFVLLGFFVLCRVFWGVLLGGGVAYSFIF